MIIMQVMMIMMIVIAVVAVMFAWACLSVCSCACMFECMLMHMYVRGLGKLVNCMFARSVCVYVSVCVCIIADDK